MRIGELSARTGVSRRLLRYYEEQGLLSASRTAGGYRDYGPEAVLVVRQVRALLRAGLSTAIIKDILPCAHGHAPELEPHPDMLAVLRRELREIEATIECLAESRDLLACYLRTTEACADET
ncbi:MerR family transcriptional regulator [Nocardia cyriacigeorgica]|uniref:MerR family transcriptional regulator n=1 Tax=Nocardia cyriacigeorgica TaxID=135487 RepID=UPI0018936125|nr:MerR family transcriptional regulator [Nocardia cyriacigeorgica]MBF6088452.1 MerR family transcriptional regulator [Nocardia cyriacigeorgica]MBF6095557.1 MerR family transcriptional regulator [Nocardia cyriacigeorgica]